MTTIPTKNFCFSPISSIRCLGLSELQYIGIYIPSGVLILGVLVLLVGIWKIPRLTLILLTIEILLYITVTTWDLTVFITPPRLDTIRTEDTVLALISPLPLLFFHLTLTSYLLEIRSSLPTTLQSRSSIILFGILLAPLIPISLVAGILPSFLSLNYFKSKSDEVFIRFAKPSDERLFDIFLYVGSISSMVYILLVILLSYLAKFDNPNDRKRNKVIYTLIGGMILANVEIGLSLLPSQTFIILLSRRTIHLVSRVCLTIGFLIWYRFERISDLVGVKRKKKGKDTINTFGTPASTFGIGFTPNNSLVQRKTTSATKRSQKTKLQIGNPIEGTFQKLTVDGNGVDGLPSAKFGMGMIVSQIAGIGNPMIVGVQKGKVEKVVVKRPSRRPPVLSFTSSTFTQSSLDALVSRSRPSDPESIQPNTAISPSTTSAKKNVGSIYRPDRISVDESELALWPPPSMIESQNQIYNQPYDVNIKPGSNVPPSSNIRPPSMPRTNSIKRKAVPMPDNQPSKRISNYFSSLRSPQRQPAQAQPQAQAQLQREVGRMSVQPEIQQLGGQTRVRSGTATERGIWFSNSTTLSAVDRPSMIYRRSTDPSQAIYPSPTASSTLEGPSLTPSPSSGRGGPTETEHQEESMSGVIQKSQPFHNQNQYSITSMYSNNQTIHTYSSSISKDLFYNPPRKSASIDSKLSLTKPSPSPLSDNSAVYNQNSSSDDRGRQSELQTVLARLRKLCRETGLNSDFDLELQSERGGDRDSFVYDNIIKVEPWMRNKGSTGTGTVSLDSDYTFEEDDDGISENLTPVAEIRLVNTGRRNYGGVV
ncbi:hypothetical protein V865_006532 [Kwoniella europaea PYCC6329]|uniref:Uncharacterized protein n=1 Tax=Kwoniella europaea PYCC6329 TaxID=1423913 RepID=A0AAX4KPK9_9TREE